MERIRIGNDIAISWALFENNGATHLINAGGASVSLNCGGYTYLVPSFSVQGNVVSFIFPAEDQAKTGKYKIVLTERNESGLVSSYDVRDAFVLVPENEMLNVGYTQQKNVEITSVITHAAIANIKTISILESEEEGGDNVVTFVLTDGSQFPMTVKNGSKGDKGDKGDQGIQGEKGDKGDIGERGPAGIDSVEAAIGTNDPTQAPSVDKDLTEGVLSLTFNNIKGEKGDQGEPAVAVDNYVTVEATSSTTSATDVLPATGSADTVYRVSNWDGTQYDDTAYTEYGWYNGAYKQLATRTPGIDDEPTANSSNLVKSGGVASQISRLGQEIVIENSIENEYGAGYFVNNDSLLNGYGVKRSISGFKCSDFVKIENCRYLVYARLFAKDAGLVWCGLALYEDATENHLVETFGENGTIDLSEYPTAKYCRFGASNENISGGTAKVTVYEQITTVENAKKIHDIVGKDYIDVEAGTTINGCYNISQREFQSTLSFYGFYSKLIDASGIKRIGIVPKSGKCCGVQIIKSLPVHLEDLSFATGEYARVFWSETSIEIPDDAVYIMFYYNTDASNINQLPESVFAELYPSIANLDRRISFQEKATKVSNEKIFGSIYGDETDEWDTQSQTEVVTINNSATQRKGLLNTVTLNVKNAGKMRLFVAFLDQRSRIVNPHDYFDIDVVDGNNSIDVSDKQIIVNENEQLFCFVDYYGNAAFRFLPTPSVAGNILDETIKGDIDGVIGRVPTSTHLGASSQFNWGICEIDSVFAQKDDLQNLQDEILEIQGKIATMGLIYDDNGNAYKIKVVNGVVVPVELSISHALALGNSLTTHPLAVNIGYYGDGWAMAATSEPMDWCSHLQTILRQKENDAVVIRKTIYEWELDPNGCNLSTLLDSELTSDVDLIIFRAGENGGVESQESYYNGILRLINYCRTKCPNAQIVISQMFWPNTTKAAAILQIANDLHLPYVYPGIAGAKREKLGDYTFGADNNEYPIINSGVAQHTGDYGFYLFANILADALGYQQLDLANNINVVTSEQYVISQEKGVSGGLISVQTFGSSQPTIVVQDANGNTITGTMHDMSGVTWQSTPNPVPTYVYTFIMPNTAVTVQIN